MAGDNAARLRALDVSQSFIVQAPAGSGKTELLIQRFLKLLVTVESPDAVVAITFTRKAAGEMRARVVEALNAAAMGREPHAEHERVTWQIASAALEHEQRLQWNLLRNPARLRIQTIDALCAEITRRMPWLARFGAMPEIIEKAEDLYREAARNTLLHLEGNEALGDLLLHLDNDFQRATQLIAQMLGRRDQWLRRTGGNPDFEVLRRGLELSLHSLVAAELHALSAGVDREIATEMSALLHLDCFPGARPEDLETWRRIADLLLTKEGDLRKLADKKLFPSGHPHKRRCEQLLARLENEGDLLERLRSVRKLPSPQYDASQWKAVEAAISVLVHSAGELQMVFRERGCVDFAELSIRASEALGPADSPADLALALGHRIQHLLVDEFQDTSSMQFVLLEKLTRGWEPGDGRTLFLVGDPMQSIYRFREADVSLFLKARQEGIGTISFEPITLSVNFRSSANLVEWINRTFQTILPEADDIESDAVAYSSSMAGCGGEATIRVHSFADRAGEAERVIELIRTHAGGSTAVLVRSRAHLIEIVSLLQRHKISFQAIEIDQLGERQVVEDLLALTFAVLHLGDRASWLALLRAPWCGLTLSDLHALAGADLHAAVWDLLYSERPKLTADGQARIDRVLPAIEAALAQRGRAPLRDLVEQTWFRLGGPACVDEAALGDAAAYFDLLEGAATGGQLDDFERFREQVNGLFAPPDSSASGQLQLMTIHKAKGLEFDTVILPGLDSPPRSDESNLLLCIEHGGELLMAPIAPPGETDPIYRCLSNIEARKNEQESRRLLYVAATRARRNLHLAGVMTEKADGTWAEPNTRSFLKLLWPALGDQFANPERPPTMAETTPTRTIRRFPAGWQAPEPPAAVAWDRAPIESRHADERPREWAPERFRLAGEALHGFLLRIAREGLETWDESAVRSRRVAYRAVLANFGVAPADLNWAADRVEAALLRTIRDSRGRWCLQAHEEAASELAITGCIDGALCEAVIDRTFIDETGVRWIIDYKTSEPAGGNVENFLEAETQRYREQLERYARLMIQREERPIRLGLYFPLIGEWREWGAGVVLRRQALLFELE